MQIHDTDPFADDRISLAERTEAYLDSLPSVDQEAAIDIASAIKASQPLAGTVVNIPVAAHQDADLIIPAMEQYNNQRGAAPFSVVLHPNVPAGVSDYSTAKRLYNTVAQAQEYFPHLDVRSSLLTPYENPTIGAIRKNLWLGTLALSFAEHGMKHDVIGINHDIDVVRVSPHYVARIQNHYDRRIQRQLRYNAIGSPLKPSLTRVSHAVLASHPNVGAVTQWVDNTSFQAPRKIGYEAGMVIPMSHYVQNGGFRADDITHETKWIHDRSTRLQYISGAQLTTSPRRYIARLQENDRSKIWTTDSFTHSDSCRDVLAPDISGERAELLILDTLHDDITYHWAIGKSLHHLNQMTDRIISDGNIQDAIVEEGVALEQSVRQQLNKAARFLRIIVGSETLAELAETSFDSRQITKRLINDWLAY